MYVHKVDTRREILERASDAARRLNNGTVIRKVTCLVVNPS
jgi:hypothetical protein